MEDTRTPGEKFFGEPFEEAWNAPPETVLASDEISQLKMSLFHIYDAFLSADYGANSIGILNAIAGHSPTFFANIKIIQYNSALSVVSRYYNVLYKLHSFLSSPTEQHHAIVEFGSFNHSTKLVFTKLSPTFSRILHVNTGLGLNAQAPKVNFNGVECYNLFAELAYFADATKFCNQLKPFLFKKIVSIDTRYVMLDDRDRREVYTQCMTKVPSGFFRKNPEYDMKYYEKMWENVFPVDDNVYFDNVRSFLSTFSRDPPLILLPTVDVDRFVALWQSNTSTNPSTYYTAYFNKAVSNIVFTAQDHVVYMRPQLAGTCTYMSTLASCLALCVLPQTERFYKDNSFVMLFNGLTNAGFGFLSIYDFDSDTDNLTSAPVIIQQLINDGIVVSEKNPYAKHQFKRKKVLGFQSLQYETVTEKDPRVNALDIQALANEIRTSRNDFKSLNSRINTLFAVEGYGEKKANLYNLIALKLLLFLHKKKDYLQYFTYEPHLYFYKTNWQLLVSFELTEDENYVISRLGRFESDDAKRILNNFFSQLYYGTVLSNVENDATSLYQSLVSFFNKSLLNLNTDVTWTDTRFVDLYSVNNVVPYIPTYIIPYFCKLTAQSPGLKTEDNIKVYSELFMRLASLFDVSTRTRIASVLLQRVAEVWKYGNVNFGGSFVMFFLVNYIHQRVRVITDSTFAKYLSQNFLVTGKSMLKVHVGDQKQAESIVRIVLTCIVDNSLDFEAFAETDIGMHSGIKNARLKFEHGAYVYKIKDDTWLPCEGGTFGKNNVNINVQPYIIQYLGVTGQFFWCTNGTEKYLLCLLPRLAYKNKDMLSEDCLFEFKLENVDDKPDCINLQKIRINGQLITNCVFPVCNRAEEVLKTQPYLCTLPRACFKFVCLNKATNQLHVLLLHHNLDHVGYLANAVFEKGTYLNTHFLLELQMKENYLLPSLTGLQQKYLQIMTENSKRCMAANANKKIVKLPLNDAQLITLVTRRPCNQVRSLSVFAKMKTTLGWTDDNACKTTLPILPEQLNQILNEIDKSLRKMIVVRTEQSEEINFNKTDMFAILEQNDTALFQLLQSNSRITTLMRIKTLFQKWNVINCNELLEMQVLLEAYEPCEISKIDAVFQIAFGYMVRKDQWSKYYEILKTFQDHELKVFQFMMGRGKSTLFTPMLLHYFTYASPQSTLHIVAPSHLKKEVQATMAYYDHILNIPVNILTDAEVKQEFLRFRNTDAPKQSTSNTGDQNVTTPYQAVFNDQSIFLYDEVDDMYDATKSTLNIVYSEIKLTEGLIDSLFKVAANVLTGREVFRKNGIRIVHPYTQQLFQSILQNESFKKNVHFGMSHKETTRFCIPYEKRLDSPMEGSRFSSPLYTLAFTARYFFQETVFVLYKEDVKNICNAGDEVSNNLVVALFTEWDVNYNGKETVETTLLAAFGSSVAKQVRIEVMAIYFKNVIQSVSLSKEVYNCSFVDILNLPVQYCKWAVGYSGTVQMDLRVISRHQRFLPDIVVDPDEDAGVRQALDRVEIIAVKDATNVWKLVKEQGFTAVIDACALFDKYNNDEVANELYKASGGKEVVYVRRDDTKMSYGPKGPYAYTDRFRAAGDVIYFYSQRHIVGTDFKQQPAYVKGLLLIGPQTTRTQAAQAMYRLRRLNKGQTIAIGLCFGLRVSSGGNVLAVLEATEATEQVYKNILLRIQYIKYVVRYKKDKGHNAYEEKTETNINFASAPVLSRETVITRLEKILNTDETSLNGSATVKSIVEYLTNSREGRLQQTIKALFNAGDSIETSTVTSTSTSTSVANRTNATTARFAADVKVQPLFHVFFIWNWTNNSTTIEGLFTVRNGKNEITISRNVATESYFYPRTYFLVQITENKFLLEPVDCLVYYLVCGKPLISMSGDIINDSRPFLTKTFPSTTVQPNKLLHIVCREHNTVNQFPLWSLFHVQPYRKKAVVDGVLVSMDDAPTSVIVPSETFEKLGYLYRFLAYSQHIFPEESIVAYNLANDMQQRKPVHIHGLPGQNQYKAPNVPLILTHSSRGLWSLYSWKHVFPSVFVSGDRRSEHIKDEETDYGIIVERNTIEENNIFRMLVGLSDALSARVSSQPQAVLPPLDILAAVRDLDNTVKAFLDAKHDQQQRSRRRR